MAFPRKRNAASAETLPATWLELADWGLGASETWGLSYWNAQVDEYINSHLYNYLFYDTENILNLITIYNV